MITLTKNIEQAMCIRMHTLWSNILNDSLLWRRNGKNWSYKPQNKWTLTSIKMTVNWKPTPIRTTAHINITSNSRFGRDTTDNRIIFLHSTQLYSSKELSANLSRCVGQKEYQPDYHRSGIRQTTAHYICRLYSVTWISGLFFFPLLHPLQFCKHVHTISS